MKYLVDRLFQLAAGTLAGVLFVIVLLVAVVINALPWVAAGALVYTIARFCGA